MSKYNHLPAWLAALSVCLGCVLTASADDAPGKAFFESKIRPVLVKHCYECHSAKEDTFEGGLGLDTRKAIRAGGDRGPAVVPNEVDESLLIKALQYEDDDLQMPPEGKLADNVIADFVKWIKLGAPDPRDGGKQPPAPQAAGAEANELWSLQPLRPSPQPPVIEDPWAESPIDALILAPLQAAGMRPSPAADATTLVRRIHFDLTGLPPSPEAAREWSRRLSADGAWRQLEWERLVDTLLSDPAFGQRWGRHWLDVARYAESNGKSRDVLFPHAWRYRDWVVDAWNADLPMKTFVSQQIAGDLLPYDSPRQRERQRVATGLLALGSKPLTSGALLNPAIVDDQIDVVTRGFLGLTAACARCHDHKFDPIPTRDYYALAGIFRSTRTLYGGGPRRPKSTAEAAKVWMLLGDDAPQQAKRAAALKKQHDKLQKAASAAGKRHQKLSRADQAADREPRSVTREARQAAADAKVKAAAVKRQLEAIDLRYAMGVTEGKVADSPIFIRGEPRQRGDVVPRGALSCLPLEPINPQQSSGRLELARWIASPRNPLTWRVMANRLWQHLFGEGIVATVDNFGSTGEQPTNPRLLDHLASRLVELEGRRKPLIREIVLSRAYRMSTEFQNAAHAQDPKNRLLWRQRRRRLEVEAIRDSLLAAAGKLDVKPRERSAVAEIGEGEVGRGINQRPLNAPYYGRTIYLPVLRTAMNDLLKTFDFPDPSNLQGRRAVTNVPLQSLYLMNNSLVWEMAGELGRRVRQASADERVAMIYWTCYGRPCSDAERRQAEQFIADWQGEPVEAWTVLCHSVFASSEFRYLN